MVLESKAEKLKCNHKDDLIMTKFCLFIVFTIGLSLILESCSSRIDTPLTNEEEQSESYLAKDSAGMNANIILYKGVDPRTKSYIAANSFTIKNKAKVYAAVFLDNYYYHRNEEVMLHIDWIDPSGNSFFRKRVDITNGDSLQEIKSAISIEPGRRDTGKYSLRVYLFRELIAEKHFLVSYINKDSLAIFSADPANAISPDIALGLKDQKKSFAADKSEIFTIKKKTRIYASVNINNRFKFLKNELSGSISWIDPDNSILSADDFYISPHDSLSEISSSISLSPKINKTGKYLCTISLFGKRIGEKRFEIKEPEEEIIVVKKIKGISADLILCRSFSKKTKKARGISDSFKLGNKAKVRAVVNFSASDEITDKNQQIKIEWINSKNKTFYKKSYKIKANHKSTYFISSISISAKKRDPGEYKCRVFYNSTLVSEKKFILTTR